MILRRYILLVLLLLVGLTACKKDESQACGSGYRSATVVEGRNGCVGNGFLLQIDKVGALPPDDLPVSFQQSGLKVCLKYSTYEDMRVCACCGGTRLRVVDIKRQ